MSDKIALITGITGQDGSYLAELLLEKNYKVFGVIRRHSVSENQCSRIDHLLGKGVEVEYGDSLDVLSLQKIARAVKPTEIYNLSCLTHVNVSYTAPVLVSQIGAMGVLNMLEVVKDFLPNTKFYQASTSEMYGHSVDPDGRQRETTPMHPVSPYGCAKLYGYSITRCYRGAYKLFACNGILFNHESPRRAPDFVATKIIQGAIRIKYGLQDKLLLGNLKPGRDWGHAKDYVRAMYMIMQHSVPDDFVVAAGKARSVETLCEYVFNKLDLDYKKYVVSDPRYFRPDDIDWLQGDTTKIREVLGWKPEYTFEETIDEIISIWKTKILNEVDNNGKC